MKLALERMLVVMGRGQEGYLEVTNQFSMQAICVLSASSLLGEVVTP